MIYISCKVGDTNHVCQEFNVLLVYLVNKTFLR